MICTNPNGLPFLRDGSALSSQLLLWRIHKGALTTFPTVGLGDLAPATDTGKLFTVMYILTGVGILVSFLDFMAQRVADRK